MLHPIMIFIVTFNTTMTILYWGFMLGGAAARSMAEGNDKPSVSPA